MPEVMWRLLWIACAAVAIAYVSYVFFGSALSATISSERENIITVDSVSVGMHKLNGVIVIPSDCHGVSLKTREEIPFTFRLEFTTWQEPYRDCPKTPALHAFETTVFAPSLGTHFVAYLDGKLLNMHVIESYNKHGVERE